MSILTIDHLEGLLEKGLLFEECGYCIKGINGTKSEIYLCASCGEVYCTDHFSIHAAKYSHLLVSEIKPNRNWDEDETQGKRTKGGGILCVAPMIFLPDEKQFEPYHGTEIGDSLLQRIEEIFQLHDLSLIVFSDVEQKMPICPHIPAVGKWKLATVHKCGDCDLTHGLWSCLSCSTISCGRRQFDGSGGNGHALAHYDKEGHPLAIRLGTIASKSPEVYCYACDSMTSVDEKLSLYLDELRASEETSQIKREQSLLEQEKTGSSLVDESTTTSSKNAFPDGTLMGIRNLGNTCYISVILHLLFVNGSISIENAHFLDCHKNPNSCLECQLLKIGTALSNPKPASYGGLLPVPFRRLLMNVLPALTSSSAQQDAVEFLQAFLPKLACLGSFKRLVDASFPASMISFIECQNCHFERIIPLSAEEFSPIVVIPEDSVISALSKYFTPERVNDCENCAIPQYAQNFIRVSSIIPKFILIQLYVFEFVNGEVVKAPIGLSLFSIDREFPASMIKTKRMQHEPQHLNELLGLGFSKQHIERAMKNVHNPSDINVLIDWLCSNPPMSHGELSAPESEDGGREGGVSISSDKTYRLSGVVSHRGKSTHCGHYFIFIKDPKLGWLMFDDEKSYRIAEDDIDFASAYLLLYSLE